MKHYPELGIAGTTFKFTRVLPITESNKEGTKADPFDERFEQVNYAKAKKESGGMLLYSDSSRPPIFLFTNRAPDFFHAVSSVSPSISFEWNRYTKVLRVKEGSRRLAEFQDGSPRNLNPDDE